MIRIKSIAILILLLAATLQGCSSAGNQQSLPGDWEYSLSSSVLRKLVDFTNQVPEKLIHQVSQLEQIKRSGKLVVIAVDKMENETQVNFHSHFQVAMARLRNNLVNASAANSKVRFVNASRYTGDVDYHLTGQLLHGNQGNTGSYYMQFQLTSSSGHVVLARDYPVK